MKLIVGLGNPGDKYEKTRHNLGFRAVERCVDSSKQQVVWEDEKKFKSLITKIDDLIFAKPQTYMNESGKSVQLLATYYKLPATDIWVVHDDFDLPFGKLRIQKGGSSAGHNGVESIIESLGSAEFVRFRVGVGRPAFAEASARQAEDYVLEDFTKEEEKELGGVIKKICEAIKTALDEGVEKAMNKFN